MSKMKFCCSIFIFIFCFSKINVTATLNFENTHPDFSDVSHIYIESKDELLESIFSVLKDVDALIEDKESSILLIEELIIQDTSLFEAIIDREILKTVIKCCLNSTNINLQTTAFSILALIAASPSKNEKIVFDENVHPIFIQHLHPKHSNLSLLSLYAIRNIMLRDIKEMKSDKFLKYGLVENLIQVNKSVNNLFANTYIYYRFNSNESSSLELQHLTIQILSIVTQNPKSKRYFNEILAFFATILEDKKTLDEEILTNITLGLSYFVMNGNNIAIDKRIIPSVIEIFEHQNSHVHLFADRTLKMYSDFITRKKQQSILNGKMIVEYLPKMLEHENVIIYRLAVNMLLNTIHGNQFQDIYATNIIPLIIDGLLIRKEYDIQTNISHIFHLISYKASISEVEYLINVNALCPFCKFLKMIPKNDEMDNTVRVIATLINYLKIYPCQKPKIFKILEKCDECLELIDAQRDSENSRISSAAEYFVKLYASKNSLSLSCYKKLGGIAFQSSQCNV